MPLIRHGFYVVVSALLVLQAMVATAQQPMVGQQFIESDLQLNLRPLFDGRRQRFQQQTVSPSVYVFSDNRITSGQVMRASYFQDDDAPAERGVGTGQGSASGTGTVIPNYIDDAQIRTTLRMRMDAGFDLNRPDRAEYFYGSWANLADHPHAIKDTDQLISAVNNRGTIFLPQRVDYQEISVYVEMAARDRFSFFVELPYRFLRFIGDNENPEAFSTVAFRDSYDRASTRPNGFSDLQAGFKLALLSDPDAKLTFQLRNFFPTGRSRDGLGTGNVSLEPAFLSNLRLTENVSMVGQAKLWTPINGGANAGNIAIYGAGLSYDAGYRLRRSLFSSRELRIVPMVEFVGWTVLDGFETLSSPDGFPVVPNTAVVPFNPDTVNEARETQQSRNPSKKRGENKPAPQSHGVQVATGQTIINAKIGFRTHFNEQDSVYIGWGRSLSSHRWYKHIARIEFRRSY